MIYGAHATPRQGFILSGFGKSGSGGKGPRLIFDGHGEESFNNDEGWGSFLYRVLSIMFGNSYNFGVHNNRVAVTAAILTFFLVEAMAILLHFLGTPIRRRKFYGEANKDIFSRMFTDNAWSRGETYGEHCGARQLLNRIFNDNGHYSDELKNDIEAFKATASYKERLLFNIGLAVAPVPPSRSKITNQFHLLLFYFPFWGPYAARSKWIWAKQKIFDEREVYNSQLSQMVHSITEGMMPRVLLAEFKSIQSEYAIKGQSQVKNVQVRDNAMGDLEKMVSKYLKEDPSHIRIAWGGHSSRTSDQILRYVGGGMDFDRIEKYTPGEDIRHIDWSATARSVDREAMVRRRIQDDEKTISLLLDMTVISNSCNHESWAKDFTNSIKVIGQDQSCNKLIFLMPGENVEEVPIIVNSNLDYRQLGFEVMSKVTATYLRFIKEEEKCEVHGLRFYTDKENENFHRQIGLSDLLFVEKIKKIKRLKLNDHNIFMVGVDEGKRKTLSYLFGSRCRLFFWQGKRAVHLKITASA